MYVGTYVFYKKKTKILVKACSQSSHLGPYFARVWEFSTCLMCGFERLQINYPCPKALTDWSGGGGASAGKSWENEGDDMVRTTTPTTPKVFLPFFLFPFLIPYPFHPAECITCWRLKGLSFDRHSQHTYTHSIGIAQVIPKSRVASVQLSTCVRQMVVYQPYPRLLRLAADLERSELESFLMWEHSGIHEYCRCCDHTLQWVQFLNY